MYGESYIQNGKEVHYQREREGREEKHRKKGEWGGGGGGGNRKAVNEEIKESKSWGKK